MKRLACALLLTASAARAEIVWDLRTLGAASVAHSARVPASVEHARAEVLQRRLEQPSPFPSLRLGARVWPVSDLNGAPTTTAETTRYRLYAMLREPVFAAATASPSRAIVDAQERQGGYEQALARQLLFRELAVAYAIARASDETRAVYRRLREVQERQLELLRLRLRAGAGTASELAAAEEQLQIAIANAEESRVAGDGARARLRALTGLVWHDGVKLQPVAPGLAAPSIEEAGQRAQAQRAEVLIRRAEAARWHAQAKVEWRDAVELDVGVGYSQGTTGTLDELAGVSLLVEANGSLDGPWRAIRARRRDLASARAAELEARAAAEQVLVEAHGAFELYQRALGLERVAEAKLDAARAEATRLRGRGAMVPPQGGAATPMSEVLAAEVAELQARVQFLEAAGQSELQYVTLLAAEGTDLSSQRPAQAAQAAAIGPSTRGLWVWHTQELLAAADGVTSLRAFCQARGLSEIYLSVPRELLADERLARAVETLRSGGVRVEALMGEAGWYRAAARRALLERIAGVAAFGARHPGAGFDGVHLDIEPQQLPENKGEDNRRFLPELIETLRAAHAAAAAAQLALAADLPRKLLAADPAEARALVEACPRLVFMLYDGAPNQSDQIVGWARRALAFAAPDGHTRASIVVGVRASDHPRALAQVMADVDRALAGTPGYAGVAVHDYRAYREASP